MNRWSTGKLVCMIHAMVDTVFKTHRMEDFPGDPVVKILYLYCKGPGLNLWSEKLDPTCCN